MDEFPDGHSAASSPREPEPSPLPTVELDDVVRRRRSPRTRILRGIAVFATLAVIAAVLLHALPAPTGTTPDAETPPLVVLLSDVSYGSVSVNGQRVVGTPPLRIALRRGENAVTLSASPFQSRTCHILWPAVEVSGGCTADLHHPYTLHGHATQVAGVTLNLTEADLPADQQAGVIEAIAATLQPLRLHTTVPAGQYFATGNDADGNVIAQQRPVPLQAEAAFTANLSWPTFTEAYCVDICPAPIDPVQAPVLREPIWAVTVPVSLHWHFTAPDGSVFDSPTYPSQQPVVLALTGVAHSWRVAVGDTAALDGFTLTAALDLTVCGAGANLLTALAQAQNAIIDEVHDARHEGCLLQLRPFERSGASTFVWRFGVLLAYGAPEDTQLAALPRASDAEFAAVGGVLTG